MKYLLIIDTSGPTAKLILVNDAKVLSESVWASDRTVGQEILVRLDKILAENNIKLADLQRVAVCRGPGGYSSLRAGIVAGSFLSLAAGAELVGISPSDQVITMIETAWVAKPESSITPQYS